MVMLNIKPEELKAIDELFKDKNTKTSITSGLILGLMRVRLQEAINAENKKLQKEKAKEILGETKKKDKSG